MFCPWVFLHGIICIDTGSLWCTHMYLVLKLPNSTSWYNCQTIQPFCKFPTPEKLEIDLKQNDDCRAAGGAVTVVTAPVPRPISSFRHFDGRQTKWSISSFRWSEAVSSFRWFEGWREAPPRAVNPSKNTRFNRLKTECGRAATGPGHWGEMWFSEPPHLGVWCALFKYINIYINIYIIFI